MPESPKSGHVFGETETRSSKNPLATRSQYTLGATPRNRRDPSENGTPPKKNNWKPRLKEDYLIVRLKSPHGWAKQHRRQKHCAPAAARTPLAENDPFAQAEAPNTLHRHGDEFADHLRTTERRGRPAYEPGAEQEVPNVQGDEHGHATPEVARRFERDVAVHKEIERAGTRDGDAVRNARRQRELSQGKHAELNERLHNRHAVIHERLTNAASERRLVGQPFGGFSLVLESRILGYLDPFLGDRTSPLDSAEPPLRNICPHVFHERDSKTHARSAPERYPFVAVEAKASRTRKISKIYDFRKCGRHIMMNPVAKTPTLTHARRIQVMQITQSTGMRPLIV